MDFKLFVRTVIFVAAGTSLAGCTNLSSSSSGSSRLPVTGTASAGLIHGATVSAYTLESNGAVGGLLASTITDAYGNYALSMLPQSSPLILVLSNGSYTEEVSGATVSLGAAQLRTVLPSTISGQKVAITPVTEIATENALLAITNNNAQTLSAIIKTSNQMIATAMGLSDITAPPASPSSTLTSAGSAQAAQYSVVLGSISQLANAASAAGAAVNSLDVAQAFATSFSYNGSFVAEVNSNPISVANTSGLSTLPLVNVLNNTNFSAAMAAATTTYIATKADPSYGAAGALVIPTYNSAPPTPTGSTAIILPTAPAASSLPYRSPVIAGPPPVPGVTVQAVPSIYYSPTRTDLIGTKNTAMTILPTTLFDNGSLLSNCTVAPSLPSGLSIGTDCRIAGTPTAPAVATVYSVIATNGTGTSVPATFIMTVLDITPHIYISDSGAVLVCAVSASTGSVGTCLGHQGGNAFAGQGITALLSGSVWSLYIASSDRINMCSVDSDNGQVSFASNGAPSLSDNKVAVTHAIDANTFAYAIDNNGISVCGVNIDGTVSTCSSSNSGLTPHVPGTNNSNSQWQPAGIDFYTNSSDVTYAYVSDLQGGGVYVCNVAPTSGVLSGCAQSSAATLANLYATTGILSGTSGGVGVSAIKVLDVGANTYAYIAGEAGNIYKCTVNRTDGTLSACVATQGGVPTFPTNSVASWSPVSLFFSSLGGSTTYAYVSDQKNSKVFKCTVSVIDGTLSACSAQVTAGLVQPQGAVVF